MSDFWSRRLGVPPQAPVSAPQPVVNTPAATPTSGPWWAQNMPTPQPAQPQQTVPQEEAGALSNPNPNPTPSQQRAGSCPECGSGNFLAMPSSHIGPQGGFVSTARCFDCGYPNLQSASGDRMPSNGSIRPADQASGGSVQATKQVAGGAGFRPDVIVGRID